MRSIELFGIYAKIALDTSDFESGVKDAKKDGESLAGQLKDGLSNAADKAEKSMKDAGDAADNMSGGFTIAKGVIANLVSGGIQLAISAFGNLLSTIWNLDEATEEYRIAMGKLNTAYEAAGYSSGVANQAFTSFYGILGDVDTATEASQLLAKLADNEEDVATWTNIAAGVYGTFGDSLPIEGLIEAANETAKTGVVTGVLADALNWAGISEDEFNAKLAACGTEAERNQLIMDTLSGTYDDAADAFYRNNEAIVAAREAQAKMDESLGKLGESVSNVKTRLMGEFLPGIAAVAEGLAGMLSGTEGAEEQFSTAIGGLINTAVARLPEFLNFGVQILSSLAGGIIQSIPSFVSAVPQIVTEIGTALSSLFPQVLDMGAQLLGQLTTGIETGLPDMVSRLPQIIEQFLTFITDNLPDILDQGAEMLNSLVNGIIDSIPVLVSDLPQIITSFTKFVADNLPKIVETGVSIIANLVVGIIKNIPAIVKALPQIISAIVDGIGDLMESVVEIGVDIVEGIWEGIQDMAGWIGEKVRGFVGGIVDDVKGVLGIASPSKTFAEIGGYMAEGLGKGWDSEYDRIKRDIESGMDFGTASVDFASSGLGVSSAGIINGLSSSMQNGGGGTYTFNLVFPDGSKLASYTFRPLVDYARANGTPILNPT